jgi:hypothetical protein
MSQRNNLALPGFVGIRGGTTWSQVVEIVTGAFPHGAFSTFRNPDDITDPVAPSAALNFRGKTWREGQVFDRAREIRWRQDGEQAFVLTCLTEQPENMPPGFRLTEERWESTAPEENAAFLLWAKDETRIPRTFQHTWGKSIVYREFHQQPSGVIRFLRLMEVRG